MKLQTSPDKASGKREISGRKKCDYSQNICDQFLMRLGCKLTKKNERLNLKL